VLLTLQAYTIVEKERRSIRRTRRKFRRNFPRREGLKNASHGWGSGGLRPLSLPQPKTLSSAAIGTTNYHEILY